MTKLSTTYKEQAEKWLSEQNLTDEENKQAYTLIEDFAKHLDSFAVLDDKLKILAYERSRQVDGEVLFQLANLLPKETVEQVIKDVYRKFNLLKDDRQSN